ncbi:hypothetical protein G6F50_017720 [Rhizopus delemar]|uniref:Uncharacterized protein n=1 Tax=Rhizopus delemar TaxID=936053 RepID=A0A9P7BZD3_9FUNG|nr:hypothetical protein G6F50_017720 [Rhizopus delemar]
MKRTQLSLIAHWAGGEIHGDDVAIDAVSNDTRSLGPGSLYCPAGRAAAADRAAAGAGGRQRAGAGEDRHRHAARPRDRGVRDYRQQWQDQREEPAAVDPAAGGAARA